MTEMDLFEELIDLKFNYMNHLSDLEASNINIMNEYLGCRVSLDCGDMGFYQGVISRISLEDQSVSLDKPFANGLACKFPQVTINAGDIQELKILKSKADVEAEQNASSFTSTVKVEKKKATVKS